MLDVRNLIQDNFPKTSDRNRIISFYYLMLSRSADIRNRLHKKKVSELDYIVLPYKLAKMSLGVRYKTYLSALEALGLLKKVNVGKTPFGYDTIAYKPLKQKLRCIATDKPLKQKAIETYERYLEIYHRDDHTGNILRENIKRTTYKDEQVRPVVHKDNFSGRYHHYLTSIPHQNRLDFTRIDGEKVVELDVTQCQIKIFETILLEMGLGKSFTDFLANGNDLYDYIKKVYKISRRKTAKKMVFKMIFGQHNSTASQKIYALFPDLEEPMRMIKKDRDPNNPSRKVYSNLACMLQKAEVFMLEEIAGWMQLKGVPFISVHDSVIIKESDLDLGLQLFESVLNEYLVNPEVKISYPRRTWDIQIEFLEKEYA